MRRDKNTRESDRRGKVAQEQADCVSFTIYAAHIDIAMAAICEVGVGVYCTAR